MFLKVVLIIALITLATVWLILGAIINPSAFLPYASAALTFITMMSSKILKYKGIYEKGYTGVINFIEKKSEQKI